MAARTFNFGVDVEAAFSFLAKQERPPVSTDDYIQARIQEVINDALDKADSMRFSLVKELMDDKNKGQSISKLRELLGV